MSDVQTVLIQFNGPDQPGITSKVMEQLQRMGATISDVEQVVVRRHLVLALIAEVPVDATLSGLRALAESFGLEAEIEAVDATPTERGLGMVVTVLGASLSAGDLSAVADAIVLAGGNIDRIVRLSRYPVWSYELIVLGAQPEELRRRLAAVATQRSIDIATQPDGLGRRSQRLIVMDVDSTLIRDEVIELLAAEAGCLPQVAEITERAMAGELDFEASLRERVRLLTGLDELAMRRALARLRLTPGARTFVRTLRRMGFKVAIVSGGFTYFTDHLAAELELDAAFANELEVHQGRLTGAVIGPVVDRQRKADLLVEVADREGIPLDQTVAIGDGANDLDMLEIAGLGIAFNAKPVVREAADTSLSVPYLDAILFILGIRRSEVEAADAADGISQFDNI